jgi:2-desacetyl-2-hydroxyethyl bacteriochlorophyllide A dehydrogenase
MAMNTKQILLPGPCEPDALVLREHTLAAPGPGKLLVRMEATGVSFAEVQMRRGRYPGQPAFPFVPGYDLVGTVVSVGAGLARFMPGQRVAAMTLVGGWSEWAEVDAATAVVVPDGVSAGDAEAVIVNGVTAWRMLADARISAGDSVLVHGAGGGVGTLLVQLARRLGASVIGTGRPAQRGVIEALGARFIDYRGEDVAARVRALAPAGVAAVFDHVGGKSLEASYRLLARRGTLISYGSASTRDEHGSPWSPIVRNMLWALRKNLRPGGRRVRLFDVWGRSELGLSRAAFARRFQNDLAQVLRLVASGELRATIAATFPLRRAADALKLQESGTTAGKILLVNEQPAA